MFTLRVKANVANAVLMQITKLCYMRII